jgi:hypothetical protein
MSDRYDTCVRQAVGEHVPREDPALAAVTSTLAALWRAVRGLSESLARVQAEILVVGRRLRELENQDREGRP